MKLIALVTGDAAEFLNICLSDTSENILTAVNQHLVNAQLANESPDEDLEMLLGCPWGTQFVRSLEWKWVKLSNDKQGDHVSVAVVSPLRDMAIYPFDFVRSCIEEQRTVTILLANNMISERVDSPVFPVSSYENIMARVRHIVPPN